jgi:hypothetical protein
MLNASAKLTSEAPAITVMTITDISMHAKEETSSHTRLLKLALGLDDSRAYWAYVEPSVPPGPRAIQAFEQRWFGTKSLQRVRTLLANFSARYDAYPDALEVLRSWHDMDPVTRQVICHWHLQLSDPTYRHFTGEFLVQRKESAKPEFDRDVVTRWLTSVFPGRAAATNLQYARKLISAATEAGLLTRNKRIRIRIGNLIECV